MRKILFFVFLPLLVHNLAIAGTGASADTAAALGKRKYSVGITYKSNTNYKGHLNDSIYQPSYSTYFKYYSRKDFRASATFRQTENSDSTETATTSELDLTVGFKHAFSKKLKGGINYSHYFFSNNTSSFQSSFSEDIAANINYDFGWLYTYLSTDYSFGSSRDFFVSFDNSHSFDWDDVIKKDDSFSFEPEIDLDFGTQSYYSRYLTVRKVKRKKGVAKVPVAAYTVSERFTMTGITLILPISYYIGNWSFDMAADLVRPLNQPQPKKAPSYGYVTAGISYEF